MASCRRSSTLIRTKREANIFIPARLKDYMCVRKSPGYILDHDTARRGRHRGKSEDLLGIDSPMHKSDTETARLYL